MPKTDKKDQATFDAIHRNHQRLLASKMATHFNVQLAQIDRPEQFHTWIEKIDDLRILTDHYLESIAKDPDPKETVENASPSVFSYFKNIVKAIIPEGLSKAIFDNSFFSSELKLFNSLTTDLFSLALGKTVTGLLLDYFTSQFADNTPDAQAQFSQLIETQNQLSDLIKQECKRTSVELIKLFQFREMLLLGKTSRNPLEPEIRTVFIQTAQLKNETNENISLAIEVYFSRELSKIFNRGFHLIYRAQNLEIRNELDSPFQKWFAQLFDSSEKRITFTQEIQLKFMQLSSEFLLEQMNQPSFLARNLKVSSIVAGLLFSPLAAGILAMVMGGPFSWGIAGIGLLGFAIGSLVTYFLVQYIDAVAYQRNPSNRAQIQSSINMINAEYLRLKKEMGDKKDTSQAHINKTKDFERINKEYIHVIEGKTVARGSVAGWFREYAARYRHSKAVEIDLGDEYKALIAQSRSQSKLLISGINQGRTDFLDQWITGTQQYLNQSHHLSSIKDFDLIQKIKEQALELVAELNNVPPQLLTFYCAPIAKGGLAGNESDFAHFRRLVPNLQQKQAHQNPYQGLCDTALNLFKYHEPLYANQTIFYGDPDYRQMLGIARGNSIEPLTIDNIDGYLNSSYELLMSLCQPVRPGINLDPLQQGARVTDEFILYKMLLLKQLASLCSSDNKAVNGEIKHKIKLFIKYRFKVESSIILDNLSNQRFLLNKDVQPALVFQNKEGFAVTDIELNNIMQALAVDMAYSSNRFQLFDVLNDYMADFCKKMHLNKRALFAANPTDAELNPQGTLLFVQAIKQYCKNTGAFLNTTRKNNALITTHVHDCYLYNVSIQLYQTQMRIAKNLLALSKAHFNPQFGQQAEYLLEAFIALQQFASTHCYALQSEAPSFKLLNQMTAQIKHKKRINEWVKILGSSQTLLNQIEQIPTQLEYPAKNPTTPSQFFSPSKLINLIENEQKEMKHRMTSIV